MGNEKHSGSWRLGWLGLQVALKYTGGSWEVPSFQCGTPGREHMERQKPAESVGRLAHCLMLPLGCGTSFFVDVLPAVSGHNDVSFESYR